ncbi:Rrf2 family transcriptional regulator [Geminicoccus roseus]|uniref:Rrf2 family transcriptional regulator n=1 Tax=Geminicoccus roseus TaxID=404900 RepID=UPI001F0AE841|nr:Rrf2 family transcriptional regulator [Geminicoccus roseus]
MAETAAGSGTVVRLTIYADYALRMLMYLSVKGDDLATIAEVANAYGISKTHLNKVSHQLGLAGYVVTARGKGGGLRLGRPAQEISLGDVVRRVEPDMALAPCFEPLHAPCPIVPACGLRGALYEARQAFLAVLDRYSLADLVQQRAELGALLRT